MKRFCIATITLILFIYFAFTIDVKANLLDDMVGQTLIETFGGGTSANHEWVCTYCGASGTSPNKPQSNGCPARHSHGWIDVGNSGNNRFVCTRCGAVVHTQYPPNSASCRGRGTSGYHQWRHD